MERHEHKMELVIRRIRADNRNYKGTTGDKAFILYACKCGHQVATDMGPVKLMAEKFRKLVDVQTAALTPVSQ